MYLPALWKRNSFKAWHVNLTKTLQYSKIDFMIPSHLGRKAGWILSLVNFKSSDS